jgi:sporulation protein YlmC with PRC-barrel domain
MSELLAENLSGKAVMGSDGTELGMLYNVTMDIDTGSLQDLVVEPHDEVPDRKVDLEENDAGRYEVPVGRVESVKDYIVVAR